MCSSDLENVQDWGISRVNRSLNYGNDGYDMVFARLRETEGNARE